MLTEAIISTFESSYKSLLQGVSQQIPKERLPGQLTAQLNMMSDPVTNLRRRPGTQYLFSRNYPGADSTHTLGWFTDIAGERLHVIVNTVTGKILLLDKDRTEVGFLDGGAYLQAIDASTIRAATVGNELFLCNTAVQPALALPSAGVSPVRQGFAYVVAGAFSKGYDVSVVHSGGSISASYTTPNGAAVGDAALATPEYIATQLATQLTTNGAGALSVYRVGPYLFLQMAGSISVTTTVSTNYLIPSRAGIVTLAGSLPARLPVEADGFVCRVGTEELPQYFKYNAADITWYEVGAYMSPTGITGMPISVYYNGTAWALNTSAYEGRFAGDDETNPAHEFVLNGITGLATYQGRLVILSGPRVSLSGSGKPRRFFRSTVTSIVDSDPIEIGSSMNSSAAYVYAIPFQKDLVLLSSAYQAVIPSNNAAVTPRTATVVPTSSHEVDISSAPITLGRTLMYPAPRSVDFFGVMEMIPSPYTDSQYVSNDATPHLPKYMGGRCRFSVASSVANMALFAPSGDLRSLIVHEYHWDGDTKIQQSWHTWTFPYDVATAYFAFDKIIIVFAQNDTLVLTSIDPKVGVLTFDAERRPFTDLWSAQTVTDYNCTVPAWFTTFDPTVLSKIKLTVLTGALAGELAGHSVDAGVVTTMRSFSNGQVGFGIPYRSSFAPTPPVIRDYNEVAISTNKATLLRYALGTKNSSEYKVVVNDQNTTDDGLQSIGTLSWSSVELEPGRALYATDAVSIIPCRTDVSTTTVEVFTDGTGELNATSLEYIVKFNQKIKRR